MADTTDEKLKQRLKDLYNAPIEYSFGQIAEASGMALDRIGAAEQRVATLEAALPAVYRLALADAVNTLRTKQNHMYTTRCDEFVQTRTRDVLEMADMIEASPTPTAVELMARIQTGEKE